ncbi:unnamed protein product, partial [Urochloa humidicola]
GCAEAAQALDFWIQEQHAERRGKPARSARSTIHALLRDGRAHAASRAQSMAGSVPAAGAEEAASSEGGGWERRGAHRGRLRDRQRRCEVRSISAPPNLVWRRGGEERVRVWGAVYCG